jgi:hypothetical protein
MAHETEAACLLRTGAQYTRRAGLRAKDGSLVFAGVKHGAFSLYSGDEPIYHVDLEGRWQRVYREGTHYRKALDNTVDAIDRVREGAGLVLRRRTLTYAEVADLDAEVRGAAIELLDGLGAGQFEIVLPPASTQPLGPDDLRELLGRIAGWDAVAWFAHRERYLDTYGVIPFLPPDAHASIVLQATLGHERGEPYVRTVAEFEEHARKVAKLWGRRSAQARSVFLAGADVLWQPFDNLVGYCQASSDVFPAEPIDVTLDDFRPGLPDRAGWERLRALRLGRVNILIASAEVDGLRSAVAEMKAAGLALGVVLFSGTTAAAVNELELSRGDLVYLVDTAEVLKPQLEPVRGKGARVVIYNPEKQVLSGG